MTNINQGIVNIIQIHLLIYTIVAFVTYILIIYKNHTSSKNLNFWIVLCCNISGHTQWRLPISSVYIRYIYKVRRGNANRTWHKLSFWYIVLMIKLIFIQMWCLLWTIIYKTNYEWRVIPDESIRLIYLILIFFFYIKTDF